MAAWRQSLSAFVLLNVLDAFTTWLGMSHGFREANLLPSLLMSLGGQEALFGLKVVSVLAALAIVLWFGQSVPALWRGMRIANVFLGLIVLSNSLQMLFA